MDISLYMICNFGIIYPYFDISKTVKILQIFSQFSRKFLQIFLRQQVHMYVLSGPVSG